MSTVRIFLLTLTLTLLMSLLGSIFSTSQTAAAQDEVKWSRVNIPTEGETGNWVLASGSNVQHLTMANDGTLYCYANPSGTSYTLFKSVDTGYNWSYTGGVSEAVVDIATAPDDASIVYYATASNIYKSADAGNSFSPLPSSPGGAGTGNITITSIDVARPDGSIIVAVGTADSDNSQYGGVYTLDEGETVPSWLDSNIGSHDVCEVAFSPDFGTDRQLVAVATDEQDTLVSARIGDGGWGQNSGNATIGGLVSASAAIAFPDDYNATAGDYILFVAIDTGSGNGDVYKVNGKQAPESSIATDLDVGAAYSLSNIDITGLAVSGNTAAATLLAGAASSTQVYISTDSGINWTRSSKQPTGQSKTCLLMAPGFNTSGIAYAATVGTESAFSYTADGGVTWNQASLIDTRISGNGIIDLAVSPCYSQDGTLFMLTFDGVHIDHSLWRSLHRGARWERVFTSTLDNVDSLNLVELSPEYGSSSQVLFLAGTDNGSAAMWKSTDNGQTFVYRSAPSSIDVWTVVNDNTLFLGSYDGSNGLLYSTTDSGLSYTSGVAVGSQPLKSIALPPDYEQDGTILIGNTNGWVYYSNDNGASFKPLPLDATSPPLTDSITVAFDSEFPTNNTVYAASSSADKGIYRFIVGGSAGWESIDSTLPVDGMLSQLDVSVNGVLYAINSQSVDSMNSKGGVERSLNPTYPLGPTFETVARGLDDGATLSGLWLRGNQFWSIDTANTRLMTFTDILALPVILASPPDRTRDTGIRNIILEWETLNGATEYRWQLYYDAEFSNLTEGFEGETVACSVPLPVLQVKTAYYWRVRVTRPLLSRWSDIWYFVTAPSSMVGAPLLHSPELEETGVSLRPLFEWSAIVGAEGYELVVSTNVLFRNPVIARMGDYALKSTVWQCNVDLNYNTTYYWKVRASYSDGYDDWSDVGIFTTQPPPSEVSLVPEQSNPVSPPSSQPSSPPATEPSSSLATESSTPAPPPPPSSPPAQSAIPGWVIYLTAALVLTIVLLVITLILVTKGRFKAS